jgi:hypothetical protein
MDDCAASGISSLQSDVLKPSSSVSSISISSTSISSTSASSTSSLLSTIQINGKTYKLAVPVPNKRGKTSPIWKEGLKLLDLSDPSKKFWMCRRCHDEGTNIIYSSSSTSHASDHLKDIHHLVEHGAASSVASSEEVPELNGLGLFDLAQFREILIRWIVIMHISFSQVEYEAFRSLLLYLNADIASHLPSSGNTVRNWIMEDFKRRRGQIKKEIHLSRSLVHFSFDMWTSPNSMSMIAIVAHYVSHTGEAKDCLLGLKRVLGTHSGENMARSTTAIIEDYELVDRLGYFMLDNIKSNDTCVREILAKLRPDLDPKKRRLRCFGHIVNLAAKAFLFGKDPEAFEVEADSYARLQQEDKELEAWRRLGPIGKLHNVVVYIRKTPQRREAFMKLANDEMAAEVEGKIEI